MQQSTPIRFRIPLAPALLFNPATVRRWMKPHPEVGKRQRSPYMIRAGGSRATRTVSRSRRADRLEGAMAYKETLSAVAGGRDDVVAQLRRLADRIEQLALSDAAEILVLLEPVLDDLRRQAALALERPPGR
jgi:hypothetical protein